MSLEEQNSKLKQAIKALPQYEAPKMVWQGIHQQLASDEQDRLIKEAIPFLNDYTAPVGVWQGIENTLVRTSQVKTLSTSKRRRSLMIAASILIVLALGYGLWPKSYSAASYTVSQEDIDPYLLDQDWDADELVFAQVVAMYEEYSQTFNDQESTALKAELNELNEAKKELKTAIELYGNDHELIRQLAALERDRTQVIKQMAFKI
jgi:cell division protein FtsB